VTASHRLGSTSSLVIGLSLPVTVTDQSSGVFINVKQVRICGGFVVVCAVSLVAFLSPGASVPASGAETSTVGMVRSQPAPPPPGNNDGAGWGYRDSSPRPRSADRCDGVVCIDVRGNSTKVDKWTAVALGGNFGCMHAVFTTSERDGQHRDVKRGPTICPPPGRDVTYYDATGPTGFYKDKTLLCVRWEGARPPNGAPCIEIQL